MSILDKRSGIDPGPWLKEKTLACLREVAELVDVANVEDAMVVQNDDSALVEVNLRLPIDDSNRDVATILAPAAESWLRQRVAGLGGGDRSAS
jgi:hypothetical protein